MVVRIKYLCLLLVVSIFILQVQAQTLFFERVSSRNLEPTTPIHGIAKDSLGYMWFGGWNGIYRYNGYDFKLFNLNSSGSLKDLSNRIRNTIVDEEAQLWVLTFENIYFKFNYCKNNFELIPDHIVPSNVISLLKNNSNQLNRDKTISGRQFYISGHLFRESDTENKSIYTYHAEYNKPGGLADDYITSFYIDNEEIIWLGTRSGINYKANTNRNPFSLNLVSDNLTNNQKPLSIRTILKTKDHIYFGTNHNGIYVFKNGQQTVHRLKECNQTNIRSLLEDNVGNIWIGSTQGLGYYNPKSKKYKKVIDKYLYPEIGINSVYCLAQAKGNNLWAGLYNGIARINIRTGQVIIYDYSNSIQNHSVMDLLVDYNNDLWIATEGSGVVCLKFNSLGECTDTLVVNSTRNDVSKKQFLSGNLVYSLCQDNQGDIWAGTSEGVDLLDPVHMSVRSISLENNLKTNYISAITGDSKDNIWISHKTGLTRIRKQDNKVVNYFVGDKNTNWVFLDGAVFNDTIDETIFFGSREGYVSFNPSRIKCDGYKPKVLLSSLGISGQNINPGDEINRQIVLEKVMSHTSSLVFNHKNSTFSIGFDALHYQNPAGLKYLYRLEGYDQKWIESGTGKAAYTKIPQGNYLFKAKAVTADGKCSNESCINIQVLPPWYQTKWAIVVYILLFLIILFLIYKAVIIRERLKNQLVIERINAQKQEEINKEKVEFFTNVSHELRTPLTLIKNPIEQLLKKDVPDNNKQLYLQIINKNVAVLVNLINQLLDFRKVEAGKEAENLSEVDLVEIIRDSANDFIPNFKERDIDFKMHTELPDIKGFFDRDKVRQISNNLLSNAMKYTPDKGKISISIHGITDKQVSISFKDNGIGISSNAMHKIFTPFNTEGSKPFYGHSSGMGLALTKKWLDLLNGTINIESKKGKGTTVTITLPYKTVNGYNKETLFEIENLKREKPVLLVVEDSLDLQTFLKVELEAKYTVCQESNGLDAYNYAIGNIPDLVISDVMMPKMDGITFCDKLKKHENTSHVPIILLSAKDSDKHQVQGFKTGADFYMTKPFSIEVLKAQIESILTNRAKLKDKLSKKAFVSEISNGDNTLDKGFVDRIIKTIHKNIESEEFNADALAKELNISRRQLYRKLEAVAGHTVHDFIVKVRMEKAVEYLKTEKLNISEIAHKVGYSEPSNFSRTFSKHFGCSPSKYR